MDGSGEASTRPSSHNNRRLHAPPVTEAAAQYDHHTSNENLTENSGTLYAESGLFGVIIIVILSPLLMVVGLVAALWELNMCMGNINPPWYKMCMEIYKRWSVAALELVISLLFMVLEALCRIFNRALLAKLLVIVPLFTIFCMEAVFFGGVS